MPMSVILNPAHPAVVHDPLGRAMTEEQRRRLQEEPSPPVEAAIAKEKIAERRRDGARTVPGRAKREDAAPASPGSIIDSFA